MPDFWAPLFLLFPNLEVGRLKESRLLQNLQEVGLQGTKGMWRNQRVWPKGCGGTKGCGLYPYGGGIPGDVEEAVPHRVGSQLSKGSSRWFCSTWLPCIIKTWNQSWLSSFYFSIFFLREFVLLLKRTWVQVSEPTLGGLQQPVTPAPGDRIPSSILHRGPHSPVCISTPSSYKKV